MPRRKRSGRGGATGVGGAGASGGAFQRMKQELENIQEAVHPQNQEMESRTQEAVRLQEQMAERKVQEALRQQKQDMERFVRMVLLLQKVDEERSEMTALRRDLRQMEQQQQETEDAIRDLQQPFEEAQEGVTAVEERTTASEGSGGKGSQQRLEDRVNDLRCPATVVSRVQALSRELDELQSARASLATAASTSADSAREAPATGGVAAGGGEEPPSSTSSSTPTPSGAGHQGAAADEEERARRRVELRVREAKLRMEWARICPSVALMLSSAAERGILNEVQSHIDSGADVDCVDLKGFTPLLYAAMKAHADVVSLLLQRGADMYAVDPLGCSALHLAAVRDRSGRCVELLVRAGADVNARNIDGETPLHWAEQSNNEEAVRALLAAGARRDLKGWGGLWKNRTSLDLAWDPDTQNDQH